MTKTAEKKKGIREISPIDVYKLLPRTNCGECGVPNCMAFATKVVNGEVVIEGCPPILTARYQDAHAKLGELLAPPIRAVFIGTGEHAVTIGGKHVLQRHEFTYQNPPPIAIDVSDEMDPAAVKARVTEINGFSYSYIGRTLSLDAIAVRSVTGDPEKFKAVVTQVTTGSDLPLILCAHDPTVMRAGLEINTGRRPLIYAANGKNWREMADLAVTFGSPVVASVPGDLSLLRSIVKTLQACGIKEIILDPGTFGDEGFAGTVHSFSAIRKAACKDGDPLFGLPILGTPISVWTGQELSEEINRWQEAYTASMLMTRYADLLIMHSLDGWVLLPQLIWRFGLYTDPRKPVSVEPGLRTFGDPGPDSPVLITSNYALTFFTVESDIKTAKTDCYLIVIETGGLSVEAAVAGRYLNAEKITDALRESGIEKMVNHRHVILPGLAARLSGETEEASGWRVLVGPRDSSGIGKMIREHWPVKEES
ncbi:MAG: acetyl-CoA decarbonylase/synthase complex subunit gamma [Methanospirillum sp.]|uniref:acetyl-CoA decarbonylase/synthase complex subunit gamma n=1 Tax=Methanospirillum sp. TaxID=45200 RepID=UPI0023744374|nr:acetyl-CoA decarbonylase/synthase complex subunit gamma [Methanospirillum sp.]MDD1728359.1 acetyl-CoA decarbonylase/synthase complex subunit gamma [Methanospirillum sp.]